MNLLFKKTHTGHEITDILVDGYKSEMRLGLCVYLVGIVALFIGMPLNRATAIGVIFMTVVYAKYLYDRHQNIKQKIKDIIEVLQKENNGKKQSR